MAEGWARHLLSHVLVAYSAGVDPHGMNPRAVRVMAEAGVDISGQKSQHIDEFAHTHLDWVITVCGHARETCPVLPGRMRVLHHDFDDPPRLAAGAASEEHALAPYRRVRDEIRTLIETLPERLQ
jgi:arsenate reductase